MLSAISVSTSLRADRLGGIVGGESGSNHVEEKDVKYDVYRKERDEVRIGDYIACQSQRPGMLRYIIYQKNKLRYGSGERWRSPWWKKGRGKTSYKGRRGME